MMSMMDYYKLAVTRSDECLFNELRNLNSIDHKDMIYLYVPRMKEIVKSILKDRGYII